MTTEFDFTGYFRDIAENLREIQHTESEKHFTRISSVYELGEFLATMKTARGYQLIVVENMAGRFVDRKSDNLLVQPYFSIFLLKQIPREDYDTREQALLDCATVCRKILSKMFYDRNNDLNGMGHLETDSISYNQAGPFGHNWIGLNLNFTLLNWPGISYDEDDWIPIS